MPDGDGLDLVSLADIVFDAVVTNFAAAGVDLPARRIMAPGAPEQVAWDCEMLACTMSGIGIGSAPGVNAGPRQAGPQLSGMGLRHVVFTFQLVRCHPEPTFSNHRAPQPPPPEVMSAAARTLWRDAGLLSHALVRVGTDLTKGLPRGTQVEAGAVTPVGPEGGFVGLQTSITVTAGNLVLA